MTGPTLRDAWMALNGQHHLTGMNAWEVKCHRVLMDTAERLVDVYDDHELGSADSGTSGADDAAALYAVLTAAGLPVR